MARPPASPEQRQRQRQRIRGAAAEVYRDDGLMGVTVRAVSQRAGVSTGTLYSYFANLEELLQSLWIEPLAEVNRQLEAIADEHPDPVARIRALLEAYVDFALAQPEVFRGAILFVRPASAPQPVPEPPAELPFYRLLRRAIEEGEAAGRVDATDADLAAQMLWAGVHGALALPVNIDRYAVRPQAELAGAMVDSLVTSITR